MVMSREHTIQIDEKCSEKYEVSEWSISVNGNPQKIRIVLNRSVTIGKQLFSRQQKSIRVSKIWTQMESFFKDQKSKASGNELKALCNDTVVYTHCSDPDTI